MFAKGMIAIFAIKIALISGLFIFQSCQIDDIESNQSYIAKNNFKKSLEENISNLYKIKTLKSTKPGESNSYALYNREYESETQTVCFKDYNQSSASAIENIVNDIEDIGDLIEAKNNHQLIIDNFNDDQTNNDGNESSDTTNNNEMENCLTTIEIPIEPILEALEPVTNAAVEYFYNNGFTESDVIEMLDGEDPSTLIPLVMLASYANNN
ncbi:MAG: hypothetical protein ACJAZK_002018 [Psychroserpens sp.]|jgi:hypothetical protein